MLFRRKKDAERSSEQRQRRTEDKSFIRRQKIAESVDRWRQKKKME